MARIVGGIGCSHAPSVAVAFDRGHVGRPEWKPFFDSTGPVKSWLKALAPDTLVVFYNDHLNRFPLSTYPTFAIGCDDMLPVADEGHGRRDLPAVPGDSELAWHICRQLVADEFDITMCQEMEVDHGVLTVLPLIADPPWPIRVVPIAINVIMHPLPTARRCWRLGQAVARAIGRFPGERRVVVAGTGGLSHHLQGKDFGFVNPQWDNQFLDLIESDPEKLAALSHDAFMDRGGAESIEMIIWLAMRGALSGKLARIQRAYWPRLTGLGLLALQSEEETAGTAEPSP